MRLQDLTFLDLAVSFLLTWSIGLIPPILMRYVILRRAMTRWGAIAFAIALWILNFFLFTILAFALGSQEQTHHPVLLLIAILSYYILTRDRQLVFQSEKIPTMPAESRPSSYTSIQTYRCPSCSRWFSEADRVWSAMLSEQTCPSCRSPIKDLMEK